MKWIVNMDIKGYFDNIRRYRKLVFKCIFYEF
jgi:hypothetical protein